jgi:hypothetical protein
LLQILQVCWANTDINVFSLWMYSFMLI